MEQNNLVFIILCGIPCSGKSTWAGRIAAISILEHNTPFVIISRDNIREQLLGKDYIWSNENEKKVVDEFYKQLAKATMLQNALVIIDNTHCKQSNIDNYFDIFKTLLSVGKVKVYIKFFDIPLWKAYLRNMWRNFRTGKYIPKKAIKGMYKSYKNIDKNKYKDLIFNEI